MYTNIISSPKPKAHQVSLLYSHDQASVRRLSTTSNIFFSQTTRPIKAKLCVESPWVGGTKVCSRHLGHMTKMAVTHIYGKTPKNLPLRNQ